MSKKKYEKGTENDYFFTFSRGIVKIFDYLFTVIYINIAWYPKQKNSAFISVSKINNIFFNQRAEILVIEFNKLSPLKAIDNRFYPSWSPDGNQIAYFYQGLNITNFQKN